MYKSSSERQNHIARTGSAATRGSATGRLDVPPGAAAPEDYFNTIRDEYDNVCRLVRETRNRIDGIDRELRERPSNARYAVLRGAREETSMVLDELERRAAEYNVLAKVAAMDAFGATFLEIARRQMDPVLFKKLMYETEMMLERKPDGGIALPGERRDSASAKTVLKTAAEPARKPAWAKPAATEPPRTVKASEPPRQIRVAPVAPRAHETAVVAEADRPFQNRLRPGRKSFGEKYAALVPAARLLVEEAAVAPAFAR